MERLPVSRHGLIRHADVADLGMRTELRSAVARGEVRRVRRGVYARIDPAEATVSVWERDAARYRREVLAASEALSAPVFTSFSAIALAGVPIFGTWPREVYVVSPDGTASRRPGLVRVAAPKATARAVVDGCAVTAIEYSLIQLCRNATLAAGLTAVDAALRVPRFGTGRPMTTVERVRETHSALLPYPGSRRVEAVLVRASSGADTPLETISRLAFEQLGFEEPELQHPMWLPELQQQVFLDFRWRSVDAGGEADGRGKYLSAGGSAEASAAVVVREKDRENAVRRQLRAFDRWDWADTLALTPLAARLDAMRVPRTRRPKLLIPARNASAAR